MLSRSLRNGFSTRIVRRELPAATARAGVLRERRDERRLERVEKRLLPQIQRVRQDADEPDRTEIQQPAERAFGKRTKRSIVTPGDHVHQRSARRCSTPSRSPCRATGPQRFQATSGTKTAATRADSCTSGSGRADHGQDGIPSPRASATAWNCRVYAAAGGSNIAHIASRIARTASTVAAAIQRPTRDPRARTPAARSGRTAPRPTATRCG